LNAATRVLAHVRHAVCLFFDFLFLFELSYWQPLAFKFRIAMLMLFHNFYHSLELNSEMRAGFRQFSRGMRRISNGVRMMSAACRNFVEGMKSASFCFRIDYC
jgi:hypothetical protein